MSCVGVHEAHAMIPELPAELPAGLPADAERTERCSLLVFSGRAEVGGFNSSNCLHPDASNKTGPSSYSVVE